MKFSLRYLFLLMLTAPGTISCSKLKRGSQYRPIGKFMVATAQVSVEVVYTDTSLIPASQPLQYDRPSGGRLRPFQGSHFSRILWEPIKSQGFKSPSSNHKNLFHLQYVPELQNNTQAVSLHRECLSEWVNSQVRECLCECVFMIVVCIGVNPIGVCERVFRDPVDHVMRFTCFKN